MIFDMYTKNVANKKLDFNIYNVFGIIHMQQIKNQNI